MQSIAPRMHMSIHKRSPRLAVLLTFILTLAFLTSCGSDSPTGSGGSLSGGGGTQTLLVFGEVNGEDAGGVFITNFFASVSDVSGGAVVGATVTIEGPFGVATLVDDQAFPGTYSAARNGYDSGTYTLNVVSGNDRLTDVIVTAPDIHVITSPTPLDTLTADQPFVVVWTRSTAAQQVYVATLDYFALPEPDVGTETVPGTGNPPRVDQRIRVFRQNTQAAAGGLQRSEFRATIRNSVEPIVSQ